jgi:hypothetical protein
MVRRQNARRLLFGLRRICPECYVHRDQRLTPRNCHGGESAPDGLEPLFVDTKSGRTGLPAFIHGRWGCEHDANVAGEPTLTARA